jgi:hypothetical protein
MNDSSPCEQIQQPSSQSEGLYSYFNAAGQRAFVAIRFVVIDAQGRRSRTFYLRPSGEPDGAWIRSLDRGVFMRKGPGEEWRCFDTAEFNRYPAETREHKFFGAAPFLLYSLPEVMEAVVAGKTIYVVENEEMVELIRSWGFVATCCPHGLLAAGTRYIPQGR